MQPQQLLTFLMSRPFEPFETALSDGRTFIVKHPEFAVPAMAGLGFWLLHESGHIEAVAAEAIVTMRTLSPVDPHAFIG